MSQREEFDKIHGKDKICLQLGTFEQFLMFSGAAKRDHL